MPDLMLDDISSVDLSSGTVSCRDGSVGDIQFLIGADGEKTEFPEDAEAVMVKWSANGMYTIIPCTFEFMGTIH